MPGVVIVLILLAFIVRVSISVIDRRRHRRERGSRPIVKVRAAVLHAV